MIDILSPLKIKDVQIKNRLLLAPVDGIFDRSFRRIAVDYGVGMTCSEMIAAQSLKFGGGKLEYKAMRAECEQPYQIQLSGHELDLLPISASQMAERKMADIIDLNMGCPSKLVTRSGNGAALLKSPETIRQIVKTVRDAIDIPLSVKIRIGWDEQSINYKEVTDIIESEGADMLTVHGRTRAQAFSGHADWDTIAEVKQLRSIPVVGNGDVVDAASARKMMEHTGCDAIMIARGTFGKPWVLKQILDNNESTEPELDEKRKLILHHIDLMCEDYPERVAVKCMRKHLAWYVKSLPSATIFRREALILNERQALEDYINNYFEKIIATGE